MEPQTITLSTVCGGAAEELFAEKLQDVLRNIQDVNTDHNRARAISIKFTFKPDEDRQVGEVTVSADAKLAGLKPVTTRVYMGKLQGKLVAVESDPRQQKLFDQATSRAVNPVSVETPARSE